MSEPLSWYQASAGQNVQFDQLVGDHSADVVIIGGGYTGLSAALELAQAGAQVILLEAEQIASGASGRNGGQLCSDYRHPVTELARVFGQEQALLAWQAVEDGKMLIAERIRQFAIDCDLHWGYLHVASHARELRECESTIEEWARLGYPHGQLVSADELADYVASPLYCGGLIDDGAGHFHPLRYALGLAKAAASCGACLHEQSRALAVDLDQGLVRTAEGTVQARHIILAGNAYLGDLVPTLVRQIQPIGSYMLATEPLGADQAERLIAARRAVCDFKHIPNYYRTSHDHRLIFGGRESSFGRPPTDLQTWLRTQMLTVFPQLEHAGIEYCWGGQIALTMSRMPALGRIGKRGYYAHGFSGQGVVISNMVGKLMADAIAGDAPVFEILARYPHRRFPPSRAIGAWLLAIGVLWFRLRDRIGL
ncbi:MAG: FAD-binding oxidoreductase [Pseudomonadota bacterium]